MSDEYPQVTITKLEKRPDNSFGPSSKLGSHDIDSMLVEIGADQLLRRFANRAKEFFLLEWEGFKIPKGAMINGHEIAWTQHGRVIDTKGQQIAVYERLVEFGGQSGKEQKMLVFVH